MRQRTHRHREMEGLPYRVLDGIRAPTTPLNLQCLKRLDSYLCRGPEPPLCSRPWAHQYLAYTVVGVFVFCLHKMTNRPSWWKEAGLSLWALISLFVWCTQVSHPGWCALLQKLVHLRKRFFFKKNPLCTPATDPSVAIGKPSAYWCTTGQRTPPFPLLFSHWLVG